MDVPLDPLVHLPEPDQRIQVFAFTRGINVLVQILDSQTGQGMVLDMISAMELTRDINSEMVRVLNELQAIYDETIEGAENEEGGLELDGESWRPPGWGSDAN